ncbi:MAG: ribosomal protein S18-alanine N-acetyltransferase [Dokdonella sp.]|uniref:ribosomal protein S18-alanine N-acetyltransferase n=1 Tax=Dokdonella sp. TaxID=2291710 RepID=UPI002B80545D|nr:ribosomal protein S18-alanine N-acetyltransferase [Dokdonella sp.]HOX72061.1 ribosomal protein S18-alanine N-acetyltransferase [Dokdonella sp.]HPG94797.1 ribosomal protein S18-alanine N-acetyltransferase [Dokdonella sp.]HPN78434.1 ribosomal protein S18-alanine N-acetyltransferase [Dokdonella sp.]
MAANPQEALSSFRAMRAQDLESIARIELSAYPYPWTFGIFRDCLSSGYECWVLERAGELIGYGVLSVAGGEAHILNLCVAPAEQGRGHGRRVLARLIDLARWHRAARVFLEVRPSNTAALALYDSVGFNEIGKRPNYYPGKRGREDAIVMAMELLAPEGD